MVLLIKLKHSYIKIESCIYLFFVILIKIADIFTFPLPYITINDRTCAFNICPFTILFLFSNRGELI